MAEKAKNGNYVKLTCHIWYDKRADNVHVTSNDKDLPKKNMHMTAKKGTQSDVNLRVLLDKHGCGPAAAHTKKPATVSDVHAMVDEVSDLLTNEVTTTSDSDPVLQKMAVLKQLVDDLVEQESPGA